MSRATNNVRLSLRMTEEGKEIIRKTAMISGQSVTAFVIAATIERSQDVIRESNTFILSERDSARIVAALNTVPEPSDALKRAAER